MSDNQPISLFKIVRLYVMRSSIVCPLLTVCCTKVTAVASVLRVILLFRLHIIYITGKLFQQ